MTKYKIVQREKYSSICESENESESHSVVSDSFNTVHGILQARILEWAAFSFSRGSPQPKGRTQVSRTAGGFFTSWATRETQEYWGA